VTGPDATAPRLRRSVKLGRARLTAGRDGGAWTTLAALACLALVATAYVRPRPLLLWNASASSPVGLYVVGPPRHLRAGDMVIAWPPDDARRLAAKRHYLPSNVPLVKRIGAVAGARICAAGERITINGRLAAVRRSTDRSGRPLPSWSGCKRLEHGELFLLTPDMPDAFDGRYFGMSRASELIGKAHRLWAKPAKGSNGG
jgi:conjugative transfer signal peptidase TraF